MTTGTNGGNCSGFGEDVVTRWALVIVGRNVVHEKAEIGFRYSVVVFHVAAVNRVQAIVVLVDVVVDWRWPWR